MALNPKQISLRDAIWNSSSPHSVSHVSSNLWWFFHEENFWYVMCNFIWCFGNLIYPFTILCFSQQRYKNSFRKVAENIFIPVKHQSRHQRHNKVKMLIVGCLMLKFCYHKMDESSRDRFLRQNQDKTYFGGMSTEVIYVSH